MSRALDVQIIPPSHPLYPKALESGLESSGGPLLHLLGNSATLAHPLLALFCARECPARLILKAQDWARSIRDQDTTIIGGFHTPVEQECLRVLLKGSCNLVICPARGLPKRISPGWREPIAGGRLLVLSFFEEKKVRPTVAMALERNRLIAALATEVLILHAPTSSNTYALAQASQFAKKPLWILDDPSNRNLETVGARCIRKT